MFARLSNFVRWVCGKPSVYYAFDAVIMVNNRYDVKITYCGVDTDMKARDTFMSFGPSTLINNWLVSHIYYEQLVVFTTEPLVIENNGKFYDLYLNQLESAPTEIDGMIWSTLTKPPPRSRIIAYYSEEVVIFNYRPNILMKGFNSKYEIIFVDMERKEIMDYKRCSLMDCAIGRLEDYVGIVKPIDLTNCRLCVKNNNSIFRHEDTYFCIVTYNNDSTQRPIAIELYPYSGFHTKPAIVA